MGTSKVYEEQIHIKIVNENEKNWKRKTDNVSSHDLCTQKSLIPLFVIILLITK